MTAEEITKNVQSLSDEELLKCADEAHADLIAAEPQSEWQESCFAGLFVYCSEMNRRGLKRIHSND